MWVQMLEGISGGRAGGGQWPPRGYLLEVSDEEGEELIRKQLAGPVANQPPPTAPVVAPKAPAVMEEAEKPSAADLPEPAPSDLKEAWVAYAVSHGASPQEAESLTKNQLQSAYGGRLLS